MRRSFVVLLLFVICISGCSSAQSGATPTQNSQQSSSKAMWTATEDDLGISRGYFLDAWNKVGPKKINTMYYDVSDGKPKYDSYSYEISDTGAEISLYVDRGTNYVYLIILTAPAPLTEQDSEQKQEQLKISGDTMIQLIQTLDEGSTVQECTSFYLDLVNGCKSEKISIKEHNGVKYEFIIWPDHLSITAYNKDYNS